jgi:hypothetical protein
MSKLRNFRTPLLMRETINSDILKDNIRDILSLMSELDGIIVVITAREQAETV